MSNTQYRAGSIDLPQVLDAQPSLYPGQDQLAKSDQTISMELIARYKSFGGGWEGHGPKSRPVPTSVAVKQ